MLDIFDALEVYETAINKISNDLMEAINSAMKEIFGPELYDYMDNNAEFKNILDSKYNTLKLELRIPIIKILKELYNENTEVSVSELVDKLIQSNDYNNMLKDTHDELVNAIKSKISEEDIKTFEFYNQLFGVNNGSKN